MPELLVARARNGQLVVVPGEEVVDMQNRSCTCGKWQKSGVVCWHGEEVCRAHGQEDVKYKATMPRGYNNAS